MNYPMKDGQIDPEFVERVAERVNVKWSMAQSEVEAVLIYAQEVMQEAQPNHDIKVGDQVKKLAGQGLTVSGQVVSIEGDTAHVVWGLVSRPEPFKVNELVKTKEAQHGEG